MSIFKYSEDGNKEQVAQLIFSGIDVNEMDSKNRSALHYASIGGFKDIVAMLLKAGASVNSTTGHGAIPLHYAARSGQQDCLPLLIDGGADINCKDSKGHTALLTAILYDQATTALNLINNYNVDVNIPNVEGIYPLHSSVQKVYLKVVESLIEKGAELDKRDPKGNTAFHYLNLVKPKDVPSVLPETMNNDISRLYMLDDEMEVDTTVGNGHALQDKIQSKKYYSDCTFVVEGQKIPAHKCIVSVRCPSFISIFNQSTSSNIEIDNISTETFTSIIEWIYKNKISKLLNNSKDVKFILSLLMASERFNLKSIISQCEYFLIKSLDSTNITLIWEELLKSEYIKSYCPQLIKHCAYIILKNWNTLSSIKTFSEMTNQQVLELFKLSEILQTPETKKPAATEQSKRSAPNSTTNGKSAPSTRSTQSPSKSSTATTTTTSSSTSTSTAPSSSSDNITMDEKNKQICSGMVTALFKRKNSYPFQKPVDPILEGIPDYPDIIKHPMDLSTIRTKLGANVYKTIRDFAGDVRLMFQNALTYNDDASHVFKLAKLHLQYFDAQFVKSYPNEKIPVYKQLQPPPTPPTTAGSTTTTTSTTAQPVSSSNNTPSSDKKRKTPDTPTNNTTIKTDSTPTKSDKKEEYTETNNNNNNNDNNNNNLNTSEQIQDTTDNSVTPMSTESNATPAAASNIRKYSEEERKTIMESISSLEDDQIKHIFTIVDKSAIKQIGDNLELDITELSNDNLAQIEDYINSCHRIKKMKIDE
ncbi:ankyrin repeat-containing protein [Tieghemostelium lacteum]|uniref:Ankyrin repeat-containing protein n=1 Tax=Tieghemostelium lacteum TaxID=361077 RepID=A0A151ZAQ9_TIELA|nr:ankyrin repeat-containing protein [Tieghemostelium lacteum]|eukprot:KYQ91025.1 ankyrin repeat-containing protein [Tieghemostelium lacteum]